MIKLPSSSRYLLSMILFLLPVVGRSVETQQVESIKVKSVLVAMSAKVFIDRKLSHEMQAQLLFEIDSDQKCLEEMIVVINYTALAKNAISAKSIHLSFDDGVTTFQFETTFPSVPCALRLVVPQAIRDFATAKILNDSIGMGLKNKATDVAKTPRLQLNGVTRK